MGMYPDDILIAKVIALSKKGNGSTRTTIDQSVFCRTLIKSLKRCYVKDFSFLTKNKCIIVFSLASEKGSLQRWPFLKSLAVLNTYLMRKKYVVGILIDLRRRLTRLTTIFLWANLTIMVLEACKHVLRSYLINMCQYTVVNGVKSDFEYVKYGAPWGSVLGPLFFLLYFNYI